jgi:hypothetical protein
MILFCSVLVLTLIMIYFGIKFLIKFLKAKEIISFPVQENEISFHIPKKGRYSLCILGGTAVNNLSVNIYSAVTSKFVVLTESFLKYKFNRSGKLGTTYLDFDIYEKGEYLLKVNNIDSLSVKMSMLKSVAMFESNVHRDRIVLLIREYSSPLHFIYSLLLLITGLGLFLLNIVYLLYTMGIIVPGSYHHNV